MDGAELPYTRISRAEHTVALHQSGRADWYTATLRLSAELPDKELAEGPWTDVVCLATLTEKATNGRSAAMLLREDDGRWRGSIDLDRSRHLNRAILSLAVVGTLDGVSGRLIGVSGRDWAVDLQSTDPMRQRMIDIFEVDFVTGPHDWLRPFKESGWIVETGGENPAVYINTAAADGWTEVLNGTSTHPAAKLLREALAGQIAQDVWTAMFHTAIGDLELDEDGTPQMPPGWRESVLRMMLPDVFPGRQLDDALYEVHERRTKGFGWAELQTSIQYAAGRRSQLAKKLTNAVRTVVRDGGGDGQ
ncbi:hypothetical protein OHA10_36910 [Kribbella sp. NBC_00662]|uniref:hypothetical protein n=1 Tax=Kribbella sp. NBC_00662 TaxID=2975969 RepID=UPI003253D897